MQLISAIEMGFYKDEKTDMYRYGDLCYLTQEQIEMMPVAHIALLIHQDGFKKGRFHDAASHENDMSSLINRKKDIEASLKLILNMIRHLDALMASNDNKRIKHLIREMAYQAGASANELQQMEWNHESSN